MLDDYGSSSNDLYPSQRKGLPVHMHKTEPTVLNLETKEQSKALNVSGPLGGPKLIKDMSSHKDPTVKQVEVQEVFDLEELSQNWDCTFIPKPVYVWVPNKSKRKGKKAERKSSVDKHNRQQDSVTMKDITNDMLPRGYGVPCTAPSQTTRQTSVARSKSPIPTGGQPYLNVGQTPKDRMRFQVIMNELKDLPRPFVIEVLEKARGMERKEDVLLLMERYLKTMKKSDWELAMVTGKVLQQQRLNTRILQHAERLPAITSSKIYKLDEARYDDSIDTEMMAVPEEVIEASIGTAKYKPLPGIGEPCKKKKNPVRVHVSTSTHESVRPFQYKKQPNFEFCLGPTRSLLLSRPASDETTQSAGQPTIPGGDMSVLYDHASMERNVNNNANTDIIKGRICDPIRNNVVPSPMLPTAPAASPYSQKIPLKDKQFVQSKLELSHSSPPGAALQVIQEMAVVNEFAHNRNKLGDVSLTTRSVIESRSTCPPATRRVASANSPRVGPGLRKRASSAGASMAVLEHSSVGQQDLETVIGAQPERFTTSRLEIASTISNWPNVDEEALLREQATPQLNRISSAASKHSRESMGKYVPTPNEAKEGEPQVRTIVIDMPPLKQHENSPAPPPPSPEPSNKQKALKEGTMQANKSEQVVDVVLGDTVDALAAVPHPLFRVASTDAAQNDIWMERDSKNLEEDSALHTSEDLKTHFPETYFSNSVQLHANLIGSSDNVIPAHNQSVADEVVDQSELEQKLSRYMDLGLENDKGNDSLSLVPDKLYNEMDMEREISLSVTPPSVLNTPELSLFSKPRLVPVSNDLAHSTEVQSLSTEDLSTLAKEFISVEELTSSTKAVKNKDHSLKSNMAEGPCPTPDVAAVMRPDDEGGLFG
ncbi:uncharacterized protein [Watersipora subatra]|uniref:uncharacterized protein n=1 Tax=Watersipora subatra TaxID=2589382 RepID=UPI00355B31A4